MKCWLCMSGTISDYRVDSQGKLLPCGDCLEASKENLAMLENKVASLPQSFGLEDPVTGEIPLLDWENDESEYSFGYNEYLIEDEEGPLY